MPLGTGVLGVVECAGGSRRTTRSVRQERPLKVVSVEEPEGMTCSFALTKYCLL